MEIVSWQFYCKQIVCVNKNGSTFSSVTALNEIQLILFSRTINYYDILIVKHDLPNVLFVLQTGPFVLKSPPMSTFHQQLWLIADINTDSQGGREIVHIKFRQP